MKIYIASSWKNQHAVEMLTDELRRQGHTVASFIENNRKVCARLSFEQDFNKWVISREAESCFDFDVTGATKSDLVVYVGPSGTDAWAEVGAAHAAGLRILGLWAKGEPAGLMRRMVRWFDDYRDLLFAVQEIAKGWEPCSSSLR